MAESTVQLWDYWFVLRKRKLMILATLVVVLLIVFLVNSLQTPIYSSYADLIVEVSKPTQLLDSSVQSQQYRTMLDPVFFDTQARLMQSSYFADLVADEMLNNKQELPTVLHAAKKADLSRFVDRAIISVPTLQAARIMRITVENPNPRVAKFVAESIANGYIHYTAQSQIDTSKQMLVFLMQKLEDIRDKLNSTSYSMSDMDIENQLSAALKVYGENHPIVQELKAKKKAAEENLQVKTEAATATGTTENTVSGIAEKKDSFTLARSAQINAELYQVLLKKLQELNITSDVSTLNVRVIEPAKVSGTPVRPNKRLNILIGIMMGMVMGVGLAFFREYLDTTVKTTEELKNSFGLTVLGLIPTIGESKPKNSAVIFFNQIFNKNKSDISIDKNEIKDELHFQVHRLAGSEQLQAPIAEAYRTLRTNLQFTQLDKPLKKLLITSSIRGEGKTTTSVNLGIILAQTGKKILIVDTDLRRPRIHKAFSAERDVGLTNLLMGESSLEDVVIPTDVHNLEILPSGPLPPNPAELVSSERMKFLVDFMESKYDLIIFDSPPLVAVTDAALLAQNVDGILLVVEAGALPRELLRQGLERLSSVKANILGCILNNVNLRKGSQYYYYYHYYHYDYTPSNKR